MRTRAYPCVPVVTFAPCLRTAASHSLSLAGPHTSAAARAPVRQPMRWAPAWPLRACDSVSGEPTVCRSHSPIAQHALDDYLGNVSENEERDAQDMCACRRVACAVCTAYAAPSERAETGYDCGFLAIFGLSMCGVSRRQVGPASAPAEGRRSSTGYTSEAKARIGPTQADLAYAGCPIAHASDNMQHRT